MKRKLFFIIMMLLASSQLWAQFSWTKIDRVVTGDKAGYNRLMERFMADDPNFSVDDAMLLYYGYAFTKDYQGSMVNGISEARRAAEAGNLKDAYEKAVRVATECPVSIEAYDILSQSAVAVGRPDSEINSYKNKLALLLKAIYASGDGMSKSTAYRVITINDEYYLMFGVLGINDVGDQLLDEVYDVFDVKDKGDIYNHDKVYFDISKSLDHMQRSFKDKDPKKQQVF